MFFLEIIIVRELCSQEVSPLKRKVRSMPIMIIKFNFFYLLSTFNIYMLCCDYLWIKYITLVAFSFSTTQSNIVVIFSMCLFIFGFSMSTYPVLGMNNFKSSLSNLLEFQPRLLFYLLLLLNFYLGPWGKIPSRFQVVSCIAQPLVLI